MDISQQDDLQRNNPAPFGFGQTDEIEVDLASPWERMGAVLLNYVFTFLSFVPLIAVSVMMGEKTKFQDMGAALMLTMALTALLVPAWQIYQLVILSKHGHTFGKKLLRLKVIKTDGSHAGFVGAFLLREVVYQLGLMLVGGIFGFFLSAAGVIRGFEQGYDVGTAIGWLFTLACVIMMFAHKERRTLQDLLADTVVVKLPR